MKDYLFSFVGFFVAMDIIGVVPMYLGMTPNMRREKRRQIVNRSILVAAIVSIVFIFIGASIFKVLGIGIYDFQVGGGTVLLVMSILDLVHGKKIDDQSASAGIVPLAMPLIAGPALITTIMLQVGLYGYTVVLVCLAANFLIAWLSLRNSALITKIIGEAGAEIASKIAALFLTAIAFSMIRSGIFAAIKDAKFG